MAGLVFEIWRDDAAGEQSMSQVSERADKLRLATMPAAKLVYTFTAKSDFDAFQKNYDWNGWGVWKPEPHWTEQPFTETEAAEQARYLSSREVR
jgi:hypothetical protein